MTDELWLDTETFNRVDLKTAGTYRYAETAEVMLFPYAINDGPAYCWDRTEDIAGGVEPMPAELEEALEEAQHGTDIAAFAHNSMFDRNVLRLGDMKIEIPITNWRDTMVQAYCHALPGSLEQLGKVLGLPQDKQKIADGKKLINRFCKPAPSNHKADRYDKHTHPAEWARFMEYGVNDVVAMRECARRMPTWNWDDTVIAEWHLDQLINDRGFAVDMELALAGQRAATEEKERLTTRFAELTGGLSPGQHAAVLAFLNDTYALGLDSSAKDVLLPLIANTSLPEELRELCQLKCDANKTSTAKYGAIAEAVSSDNRFRGGLQFAGAPRTRRWAGRLFQPQNLPSRGLPDDVDAYIDALKAGVHDLVFDDLMLYGAAALRGLVIIGNDLDVLP